MFSRLRSGLPALHRCSVVARPGRATTRASSFSLTPRCTAPPRENVVPKGRWLSSATPDASSSEPSPPPKEFRAETRQLLDLVIHSLYTDKEVFLRELVSNASDACERMRFHAASAGSSPAVECPLEIHVNTDSEAKTLTISDSGTGMTGEEMENNLGTIAHSGSKAFLSTLEEGGDAKGIIGKFGVGFYSSFMVAGEGGVTVTSRSASLPADAPASVWSSDGIGTYTIADAPTSPDAPSPLAHPRGSAVTIHLSEASAEYSDPARVEAVLKKYSNFVAHPIFLNGERVNTVDAVWARDPTEKIDDETYNSFYKFAAGAYDEPWYRLHYRADAPVEIRALLFVPSYHTEKYGMGAMDPGVSLYSRKVLIEAKSPDILPNWMRFVKGVVDSEDLPLSVSRERAQDSALITKLRTALVRKFTSFLSTQLRKDPEKYKTKFFPEFGHFLKEGICRDHGSQDSLSKLIFFESSKMDKGETTSLEEYVGRCTPDQKEIYYICAPSRQAAEDSPYFEIFLKTDKEVLFVYSAMDEFVMSNLEMFQQRKIVSAEGADVDVVDKDGEEKNGEDAPTMSGARRLTDVQAGELCTWLEVEALPSKLAGARMTKRLATYPAMIVGHESGALRRMMALMDTQQGGGTHGKLPKQTLEINPAHQAVIGLNRLRESDEDEDLAILVAEQLFDNAVIAAGLMDDGGRHMLPRLNEMLVRLTTKKID